MRRLWSYVVLTGASLVLMGSTFANVFKQSTSNIEYADGKEMVFRLSDKETGNALDSDATTESGEVPSESVAKSMVKRLDALKITNYQVYTEGNDTVKVIVKQDNDSNYQNVQNLMTFNGSLALSSRSDDAPVLNNANEEEKFLTGNAYMETKNDYPSINIPVGNHFKELYDVVKQAKEDGKTEFAETSTEGEGDDATTTETYYLYLWHDYNDLTDKFSYTISGNENYDEKIAQKVFMNFDIAELQKLEEEDKEIDKLTAYVNIQDVNSNGQYEASEVRKAFDTARYYVALINSGVLEYEVSFLYSTNVAASTEQLVEIAASGPQLAWSATLRATIVCVVVLSLLAAVFYRLSALAVATTTIGSVFAGVASIILFTAEFNAAGLIALVAVAVAALASNVIYLTKLKDEAYRGRSLKKANSEAAKKSLLPILDVNVVLIILGVFAYIFGGALMRSFAIISVIGGLGSLLLNLVVLRGLMWLVTNATKLQGKYEMFGIDSKRVPNLLKEEKQTFFGSYADKDFTHKKKPVGIIAAVLLVTGIAGMVTFGVLKDRSSFMNKNSEAKYSEIFFESKIENAPVTETAVREVLANTFIYQGDDDSKATSFEGKVADVIYNESTETKKVDSVETTIYHTYCVVKLSEAFAEDKYNAYYVELDEEGREIGRISSAEFGGVIELIKTRIDNSGDPDILSASIKDVKAVTTEQPDFFPIVWGTLVGLAVSAVYLLLRYRLSRGLATLVVPTGIAAIAAGALAFLRVGHIAALNYSVVVLPVIAFFGLVIGIFFMNRERELVLEDKNHDDSIENRNAIMVRANSLAYSSILLISVLAIYIAINFFGFGASGNAWMFLVFVVGVILVTFLETTLYGPISQFFYKLFSKVNTDKITNFFKRKKKKKVVKTPHSAEPEERTFIGIND